MADPLAPTEPVAPRDDDEQGTQHPSVLVRAAPTGDALDLAMAKARTEAALFGEAPVVKVGRYTILERAGAGGMAVVWSAWDPELNRGVALKLASTGDAAARARARDEGRALAKLSHPNVVPIYDVFEASEGVFLVMELVAGKTLRRFADDATVRTLIHAYRQAGDGLAAAHRAGLVHRDFKPENAIVGADGRVRVLDFGLAHEDGATPMVAGTPRYMAPEQKHAERALTAAVDQFALCVSLREAITEKGGVPRWLEPVLARGAAKRAEDRYPSMDELLRALALDPRTRWRRRALVGGGVLSLGAVAIAFTIGRARQEEEPCEGGAETIAASWGGSNKSAAETHLRSLTSVYARDAAPRVGSGLDAYATGWVDLHRNACRAHQRGELSPVLFDRRSGCLAIRKSALATVGELATAVTDDGLPDLVVAVGGLPDLRACENDDALLSPVAPPTAMQAPEAAAIAELIARVDVEHDAAQMTSATRDADAVVVRAKALGYAPLIARALLARGRIDLTLHRGDQGASAFTSATLLAVTAGDEPLAIEAYARGAYAIGTGDDDKANPTDGLPLIEAMTERVGQRAPFPRSLLHNNLGSLALARGDRTAARAAFERARREAVTVTGSGAIELTAILRNLLLVNDDPRTLADIGAELVATRSRLLGEDHPRTIQAQIAGAELIDDSARVRAELGTACSRLHDLHPSYAFQIGTCSFELAWLAVAAGDLATARTMVTRALESLTDENQWRTIAAGYKLLLDGNPSAAVAKVAPLESAPPAGASWVRVVWAADAALAAAFADSASGRPAEMQRELTVAEQLLVRLAPAVPPALLHRRQRAIAELRRR